MKPEDFDYELPRELIAQRPAARRDAARLLVLDRSSGVVAHRRFSEVADLLRPADLLVLNDTRVVPARLVGSKPSGGRVELLLIERIEPGPGAGVWRALLKASRKPRDGGDLVFPAGVRGRVLRREGSEWLVRLECDGDDLDRRLDEAGRPPLPPYIRRENALCDEADRERYQTVYAERPGAIAAPTAGLHFTTELLAAFREAGVSLASITLHVGPGTFQPVGTERIEDHRMHEEAYELPESTAEAVAAARRRGGRVVAVGTTVVRTLEHCAEADGRVRAGCGRSSLFIYPGFRFRVVDAMITNFHLPRSTLLMLVSAFAGRERVLDAYRAAVAARYRFFSYGDAMWISESP